MSDNRVDPFVLFFSLRGRGRKMGRWSWNPEGNSFYMGASFLFGFALVEDSIFRKNKS